MYVGRHKMDECTKTEKEWKHVFDRNDRQTYTYIGRQENL